MKTRSTMAGVLFFAVLVLAPHSPAWSAITNAISFNDNFDGYNESDPLVNGTNGWWASTNINIAQSTVAYSDKAALISADSTLSNRYSSSLTTNIWWSEMYSKAVRYQGGSPTINSNAAAMFIVNSNGYVVIHAGSGTNWNTVFADIGGRPVSPLSTTAWHRINMVQNYTNKTWSLFVNNVLISQTNAFINSSLTSFGGFDVYNGTEATSYVDNVIVTGAPPSTLTCDTDADGMRDVWEISYFGSAATTNTSTGDPDNDGYSNGDESNCNTDPLNVNDYPGSPPVFTYVGLPYLETFESYAVGSNVVGKRGWSENSSTSMIVQTDRVFGDTKSLRLGEGTLALENIIPSPAYTSVYFDVVVQPNKIDWNPPDVVTGNTTVAFGIWTNGYVIANNGTNFVSLNTALGGATTNNYAPIPSNQWVRIVANSDYNSHTWSIWLLTNAFSTNELARKVGHNLAFRTNTVNSFVRMSLTNYNSATTGYLDNVRINFTKPDIVDSDGDGIPDNYEDYYGLTSPTNNSIDSDGDGYTDLQEYVMNTDPNNSNSYLKIANIDLAATNSQNVVLTVSVGSNRAVTVLFANSVDGTWTSAGTFTSGATQISRAFTNVGAVSSVSQRFYKVVAAQLGMSVTNQQQLAMYRQNRTPTGTWFLVGVPVDYAAGSNNLNSTLGRDLMRGLAAGNSSAADHLYILTPSGIWSNFFMASGPPPYWRPNAVDEVANIPITPGMGLYIQRKAGSVYMRTNAVFCGFKRTNTTYTINISSNWNIVSWPFDRPVAESVGAGNTNISGWQLFYHGAIGTRSETNSDLIWAKQANGSFKKYMLLGGYTNAAYTNYNGRWWDSPAGTAAAYIMENGKAFFYLHRGAGITWAVTNAP